MRKLIKELYWAEGGFKAFPNLFVWMGTIIFLSWVLSRLF